VLEAVTFESGRLEKILLTNSNVVTSLIFT
jgi:hypothetical protein